ncbi:hypothetical protein NL676_020756 [Syzygium grande]|nr:hypothetical protein NL676_020756 [Syzygium grande]
MDTGKLCPSKSRAINALISMGSQLLYEVIQFGKHWGVSSSGPPSKLYGIGVLICLFATKRGERLGLDPNGQGPKFGPKWGRTRAAMAWPPSSGLLIACPAPREPRQPYRVIRVRTEALTFLGPRDLRPRCDRRPSTFCHACITASIKFRGIICPFF